MPRCTNHPAHSAPPRWRLWQSTNNWDQQRRYIHKYVCRDIDTHTNIADPCCLIVSIETNVVPAQPLAGFCAYFFSSDSTDLKVWGDQSIVVFSHLHCNIAHFTLVYPTDCLFYFRNWQKETCRAICQFFSAGNMGEVDKGEFLPLKLFCRSEIWHYCVCLTHFVLSPRFIAQKQNGLYSIF